VKSLRHRQEVNEILTRLENLTPATPHLWGKMSAHQMICHLNDAFKLYTGVITAAPPGFPYPSKLLKWACLLIPIQWPKGFKTVPEVDQEQGGTRPVEFVRDVAELRGQINYFTEIPKSFAWPTHPYLGRMSASDWMRLGYLHTDHHLRQFGV
jgi:hypothetical protein